MTVVRKKQATATNNAVTDPGYFALVENTYNSGADIAIFGADIIKGALRYLKQRQDGTIKISGAKDILVNNLKNELRKLSDMGRRVAE